METHPGTKIHTGLSNLAFSPTYLHTSDSRGENNPPAIHLLQSLPASLYFFFTAELFLILVLAERNIEQQWLGDIWKPCQGKQCLNVCIRSANLVQACFNFTKKAPENTRDVRPAQKRVRQETLAGYNVGWQLSIGRVASGLAKSHRPLALSRPKKPPVTGSLEGKSKHL